MRKTERIAEFVTGLEDCSGNGGDPYLAGYFACFNSGRYYEAHDVLEDLWIRQGKEHPDYAFLKGLIQLAGGFVHLRLQHLYPEHPRHGRRLAPACRLLSLAAGNLRSYPENHLGVDVAQAILLAEETVRVAGSRDLSGNPWRPSMLPSLRFPSHEGQERR